MGPYVGEPAVRPPRVNGVLEYYMTAIRHRKILEEFRAVAEEEYTDLIDIPILVSRGPLYGCH